MHAHGGCALLILCTCMHGIRWSFSFTSSLGLINRIHANFPDKAHCARKVSDILVLIHDLKGKIVEEMKKQVVGIFGSWDLSIWSRPEDVFREKLEENHIHPFTETGPNRK